MRGADLVVLAVKADGALDTARAVASALGDDAAALGRERDRVPARASARCPIPTRGPSPSASRTWSPARSSPGLHSIAAANLDGEPPDEDALVCGDDPQAKELALELAARIVAGSALDAGPLAGARDARGADRGDRQPEPPLQGARRHPRHRRLAPPNDRAHPGARPAGDPAGRRPRGARSASAASCAPATSSSSRRRPSRRPRAGSSGSTSSSRPTRRASWRATSAIRVRSRRSCARRSEIVRERGPLVIAQTRHGFICASAGVDHSNAPEPGMLVLLPLDPDASAASLRRRLARAERASTSA